MFAVIRKHLVPAQPCEFTLYLPGGARALTLHVQGDDTYLCMLEPDEGGWHHERFVIVDTDCAFSLDGLQYIGTFRSQFWSALHLFAAVPPVAL